MTVYRASACAKIILCGEHAVVYGRPAIAVPVPDVRSHATFTPAPHGHLHVFLDDLGETWTWREDSSHPLAVVIRHTFAALGTSPLAGELHLHSDIPIGGGLGSSASVATAVVRVLARALGVDLPPARVAAIVYEGERIWHGTPSGIDNTVIAYEQPIWFVKDTPPRPIRVGRSLTLVIGDSGIRAATREVVGDVRRRWQEERETYEAYFDHIAHLVRQARTALEIGDIPALGRLLDENQYWLERIGVSGPELERLIRAAREAGAWGAKLAGAGRGGNMIALVPPARVDAVVQALRSAGAVHTYRTTIPGEETAQ